MKNFARELELNTYLVCSLGHVRALFLCCSSRQHRLKRDVRVEEDERNILGKEILNTREGKGNEDIDDN